MQLFIEAVHAKMEEEHLSPLKATKKTMHEIAGAIIAITFDGSGIYSCSFHVGTSGVLPSVFDHDGDSNYSVGIVALTLTPALCAMMLKTIMVL
jgi:HAE1 family hydrophobic/amphiphilic exporter-1